MRYTKNNPKASSMLIKQAISTGFITYTCTNHPEIILKEPGVCPECGKALVKKY